MTFEEKKKQVNEWLKRYPKEMHGFLKDIIVFNALHHPNSNELLQFPGLDNKENNQTAPKKEIIFPPEKELFIEEKIPEKEIISQEEVPQVNIRPEDKKNIDSWFDL